MPSKTLVKDKSKPIVKNPGGQPPLLTPQELEDKIQEYWKKAPKRDVIVGISKGIKITESKQLYTIAGLALFCGFANRQSLYDLAKVKRYSDIIKKARARIEQLHEERLFDDKCTGSIFWLKCHSWKDSGESSGPDGSAVPKTFNVQINYFLEKQGLPSIPLDAPKELGAFVDSGEISAPEEPTD